MPKGSRFVFQPSCYRGELLSFKGVKRVFALGGKFYSLLVGILAHLLTMVVAPKYYAFWRSLNTPIIIREYDWMPRDSFMHLYGSKHVDVSAVLDSYMFQIDWKVRACFWNEKNTCTESSWWNWTQLELEGFTLVNKNKNGQTWTVERDTVDGLNPKQPPGMVLKPCK